jgi:cytidylate kinase
MGNLSKEEMIMVIAMDGPAGAGKSTISKLFAEKIGFIRLDTGALYRGIALVATRAGLQAQESDALQALLNQTEIDQQDGAIYINGILENESIRTPEISKAASDFATLASVRHRLLELQRKIGKSKNCILDGRDIGTVVFPDADLKIYLTASVEARAERSMQELSQKGVVQALEAVKTEIAQRDEQDMNRKIAPLKQATDAILVDATHLSIEEAVNTCYQLYLSKC